MCNCEYCVKCQFCGHQADEHIAGNGACFICECPRFVNKATEAWDNLNLVDREKFPSFQEFIDKWGKI